MLASVFGTKVNSSWLMSSVCNVFWQISTKRCEVKQQERKQKHEVAYEKQRAKCSVYLCIKVVQNKMLNKE